MADDLERLRDILFGSQARTIEQRLHDLEAELAAARQELTEAFDRKLAVVNDNHLDLSGRVAHQAEQSENRDAELLNKLEQTRQSLSDRADQLDREHSERLERARAEMLASMDALRDQKVSREDLGQMLIDLGQRLRANHPAA
jgi:uncharacterized phage infection (PIP) family protein YhgE